MTAGLCVGTELRGGKKKREGMGGREKRRVRRRRKGKWVVEPRITKSSVGYCATALYS